MVSEPRPRPTGVNMRLVGRRYAPRETYRVSAAKIAEMAHATGATHPAHTDINAAQQLGYTDVVAPPTFAVIVAQRAEQDYISDPVAGIDFSRVVHAEQRFTHHRPILAGDELRAEVHVDDLTERRGMTMVTTRTEITDINEEPVASVTSTLAVRGEER